MPKSQVATSTDRGTRRHNPLAQDILATGILRNKKRAKSRQRGRQHDEASDAEGDPDGGGDARFIDAASSRKILRLSRNMLAEDDGLAAAPPIPPEQPDPFAYGSRLDEDDGEDEDGDLANEWSDYESDGADEAEVDANDLDTFRRFLPEKDQDTLLTRGWDAAVAEASAKSGAGAGVKGSASAASGEVEAGHPGGGINLTELILQKIAHFEAARERGANATQDQPGGETNSELPAKVVEVYTQIGQILSRYRSGKLPKPFKIIPQMPRWEEIIQLCNPWDWTPQACLVATRLFVTSRPVVVQRFLRNVLLEKVRDDIRENRKLNVHLFDALKKSLFKPAAFFKGFLFPLVRSGSCTLREAHIVAGALTRVSVPVLHSAAAIKGLCDIAALHASQGTEGGGATNVLIRALLAKKMALPYQVIDALVFHFLRFRSVDPASVRELAAGADPRAVGLDATPALAVKLPVLWHQCLLEFAQRYRNDITEDQREALLDLLLSHGHAAIGDEVRRELLAGRGRGVPIQSDRPSDERLDGDDTMMTID